MTDKLNDNDRKRIEQEAFKRYPDDHDPDINWGYCRNIFSEGYTEATLFERQQQTIPKPCPHCGGNGFTLGYENVHVNCKHCKGTGEQSVEAELRNKLIEIERRIKSVLKASTVHDKISILEELEQLVNSLKTK